MGHTIAYLRKSRPSERELSWELQQGEILGRISRDGLDEPDIFSDWHVSGARDKLAKRPGYQSLRDRIEAGGIDSLYAFDQSRLVRDTRAWLELVALCTEHGVRAIRFVNGQDWIPDDDDRHLT